MIKNENGKPRSEIIEKPEAFNCERCTPEMLENRANEWQDPDHPGEKIKMCNSYYGLITVKDKK